MSNKITELIKPNQRIGLIKSSYDIQSWHQRQMFNHDIWHDTQSWQEIHSKMSWGYI